MKKSCKVLFYIKRNAPLRSGLVPIMGRITVDGQRTQFSTRLALPPEAWDVAQNRAVGRSLEMAQINRALDEMRIGLEQSFAELRRKGLDVTPNAIRDRYFQGGELCEGLVALVARHNASFRRQVGIDRSQSSLYKYQSVQRHLERFTPRHTGAGDLPLHALSREFLTAFHGYLLREMGHRKNTIWVYMAALKHILQWARRNGVHFDDPFVDYRLRSEQVSRQVLTEAELERLMRVELPDETLRLVRDIFLFSCFTGLSFIDLQRLTWAQLVCQGEHWWIETTRRKTGSQVQVRLLEVARSILEKYAPADRNAPIFALPSNSWCNRCLARLMRHCGIEKHITFHAARHTFATTLALSNGMPIETISRLLGHSSIRTTQIYATVTRDHLDRELSRLSERLEPLAACWRS